MSLAERIKALRKQARYNQAQVAELIGVRSNTIWRWENDKATPSAAIMPLLASALNTTVAYLSGETDNPERAAPPEIVKVETQTQTRDRGELFFRFPDGSELRLPDTPENKAMFKEMVSEGLRMGRGER